MEKNNHIFRVGEEVMVAPPTKEQAEDDDYYHHLLEGAIVKIVGIYEVRGKTLITVQGNNRSFRQGDIGWFDGVHGEHCQEVLPMHLIPISNKHLLPAPFDNPQLPII